MAVQAQQAEAFSNVESVHGFAKKVGARKLSQSPAEIKAMADILISFRKPLGALKQLSSEEFARSPLGKALSTNPVWTAITSEHPSLHEKASSDDIENFFLLIFKFMKSDHTMNTQLQLSSMVNMTVQCSMLDRLTSQATAAMADMDKQIKEALDAKPDFWKSVFLPLALTVVGALAGCLTAGMGGAATEAATAAAEGAEAGVEAGATAATSLASKAFNAIFSLRTLFGLIAAGGLAAPGIIQSTGFGADKSGEKVQGETAMGQAAMNLISASMEGSQGRIKQESASQQNDTSNEQADLSMLQQMIQAQQQAFGLGKL